MSPLFPVTEVTSPDYDAVLVITDSIAKLTGPLEILKGPLEEQAKVMSDVINFMWFYFSLDILAYLNTILLQVIHRFIKMAFISLNAGH